MAKAAIAAAAVIGAATGIYSAVEQKNAQRKSLARQVQAQKTAEDSAIKQNLLSQENIRAANRKSPDVAALLAENANPRGPATLLSRSGSTAGGLTGSGGLPTNTVLGL